MAECELDATTSHSDLKPDRVESRFAKPHRGLADDLLRGLLADSENKKETFEAEAMKALGHAEWFDKNYFSSLKSRRIDGDWPERE